LKGLFKFGKEVGEDIYYLKYVDAN